MLDAVVENGNPADSSRYAPMLQRHQERYGSVPRKAAFDAGYASRENPRNAKDMGIEHVVFHRKRGLRIE